MNNEEKFKNWLGKRYTNYPSFLKRDSVGKVVNQETNGQFNSIYDITDTGIIDRIVKNYKENYANEDNDTHNGVSSAIKKYKEWLKKCNTNVLNKIIYGAPGTGKSWKIKNDLRDGIVYRTTFHPDTDYATFVGCFKPSMDNNNIVYKFQRQVFMDAYVKAWEEYLTYNNNSISKVNSEEKDTSTQTTYKHVFLVIEEINRGNCAQIFGDIFQLLDRNKKGFSEYAINPDKDIEDELKKEVNSTSIQNAIKIECEINNNHNNNAYYLALPPNLHIWATMNTSDQSLFPMDSAFKRRWEWEYIKIDYTNKQIELDDVLDSNGNKRNYSEVLEKINARIKTILHSADKQMGVFFVKSKDDKTISFKDFRDKVIFYLFNDVFKNNKKFAEEFFCQDYPANFLFEDLLSRDDKDQKKIVNKWLSGKDYFGENNEQ